MQTVVGTGPTLEDAVKDALARLGAAPEQAVLRKVEEGSTGLMGAAPRPYRVRATWKPEFAPPPPLEAGPKVYGMAPTRAETFTGDTGGSGEDRGPRGRERERERGGRSGGGDRGSRSSGGDRGGRGGRDRPAWIDPEEGKAERLSRPARKASPISGDDRFVVDEAFLAQTRETARWLIQQMGFDPAIAVTSSGDEVLVAFDSQEDDELLSGRRGETRVALQTVLSRLVNPKRGASANVMVDVNGFWQTRRDALLAQAKDLADQAVATGEEMVTGPLAAEERRLVHRMLADDPRVATESFGEGATKRMSIRALDDVAHGD